MNEEPNSRHSRPIRATRGIGERGRAKQVREKVAAPPMTPQLADWLRANGPNLTTEELSLAMQCCYQEARKRCREVGVRWRERDKELQPNVAEGFEPAPLPDGERLDAPAGSLARIEKYRQRADSGVELWDAADDVRRLPVCMAKLQAPKDDPRL